MRVQGSGRFDGDSDDDVALWRRNGGGGAVGHGGVLDIDHFVLCGGADPIAIGGSVGDLRITAATDLEDGARFLVGERAQEGELLRGADRLGELDVDAGERGGRQGGARKEEDGQMTEGGRGWKGKCVLRGRDNGGGGDQDRARGQHDAEEGWRRRGHFGLDERFFFPPLSLCFRELDGCGGSSRKETEKHVGGDWVETLCFQGWWWNEMEGER